ncbi:GC-rich sequence DNA-binding factor 2 [Phlyctochytrium planicorne]|nr:GC-rich sequence DNA-binding factor 2 [Phlyctochytrium planicorne]
MFNAKKKRQNKPVIRQRQDSEDEQESKDDTVVIVKPSNPSKAKTKGIPRVSKPSFDDEEELQDAEPIKIKKSAASRRMAKGNHNWEQSLNAMSTKEEESKGVYTAEYLRELAMQQKRKPENLNGHSNDGDMDEIMMDAAAAPAEIKELNQSEIAVVKKLREQKRAAMMSGGFEPLDEESGAKAKSSRLETEDHLMDEEEMFDDYKGDKIAFGKKSAEDWKRERAQDITGSLQQTFDDSDQDEEADNWQRSTLNPLRNTNVKAPRNYLEDSSIPSNQALVDVDSSLASFEALYVSMEKEKEQTIRFAKDLEKSFEDAHPGIEKLEGSISETSLRYNYYQELLNYFGNLSSFLDEKISLVESIEKDFVSSTANRSKSLIELREELLSLIYSANVAEPGDDSKRAVQERMRVDIVAMSWPDFEVFMSDIDSEFGTLVETSLERKADVFADVSKQYRDLSAIKQKFLDFSHEHSEDFKRCYASLSFPSVADLFIRHDMLGWNPFTKTVRCVDELQRFKWFRILSNNDLDDEAETPILTLALGKSVLPRLRAIAGSLDLFSDEQVSGFRSLLLKLSEFSETDSKSFKALTTTLAAHMEGTVAMTLDIVQKHQDNWISLNKELWLWPVFILFKNLFALPFVPPGQVTELAIRRIFNEVILPYFTINMEEEDLGRITKLVEVVPNNIIRGFNNDFNPLRDYLSKFGKTYAS